MGVGGQRHAPAALPPGKTQYLLYRRLGEPQGRSEQVRKISPTMGFDHRTVAIPTDTVKTLFMEENRLKQFQLHNLKFWQIFKHLETNRNFMDLEIQRSLNTKTALDNFQVVHPRCVCSTMSS